MFGGDTYVGLYLMAYQWVRNYSGSAQTVVASIVRGTLFVASGSHALQLRRQSGIDLSLGP